MCVRPYSTFSFCSTKRTNLHKYAGKKVKELKLDIFYMPSWTKGRQVLYFLGNKRNFRALHFLIFFPITVNRSPAYLIRVERKLRRRFEACTFFRMYKRKRKLSVKKYTHPNMRKCRCGIAKRDTLPHMQTSKYGQFVRRRGFFTNFPFFPANHSPLFPFRFRLVYCRIWICRWSRALRCCVSLTKARVRSTFAETAHFHIWK